MTTAIARKRNGETVDYLRECLTKSEYGLSGLTTAVKLAVKERAWEGRVDPHTDKEYECESFVELITAPPIKGLGWTIEGLKKLCQDDREVISIIDQETQRPVGKPVTVDNIHSYTAERPSGTSVDRALRKLRADAPELHRQVLDGTISPHAAMIEAGFRRKSFTMPADPERAAVALSRHFTPDELREIVRELADMIG